MTAKDFVLSIYPKITITHGKSIMHPNGFIAGHMNGDFLDENKYFAGRTSSNHADAWEMAKQDILKKMVRKLES